MGVDAGTATSTSATPSTNWTSTENKTMTAEYPAQTTSTIQYVVSNEAPANAIVQVFNMVHKKEAVSKV